MYNFTSVPFTFYLSLFKMGIKSIFCLNLIKEISVHPTFGRNY